MIIDILIGILAGILTWVFSFIPQVTSMPSWYTPIREFWLLMSGLNGLPFIGTVITIGALMLAIVAGWQVVVFANWLYNKIRGSG